MAGNESGAVVITGASTGIGRATALFLDGKGYRVFAGVRKQKDGKDLEEIRPFVDCLHAGIQARQACPGGIDVYRRKLAELDSRMGELQSLRDRIARELRQLEAITAPAREATR